MQYVSISLTPPPDPFSKLAQSGTRVLSDFLEHPISGSFRLPVLSEFLVTSISEVADFSGMQMRSEREFGYSDHGQVCTEYTSIYILETTQVLSQVNQHFLQSGEVNPTSNIMSVDAIHQLAENLPEDDGSRLDIYRAARELMLRAEPPRETCFRLFWSNGGAAAAVIAVDINLFRTLAQTPDRTHTLGELSKATGADPKLLIRLLKALDVWGAIAQVGPDAFKATNNTIALTTRFAEGAAQVQTQFSGPIFTALPSYLEKTGYKNPSDTSSTAFHQAYNTQMDIFEWFGANKKWSDKVMSFMGVQRDGQIPWMPRRQFLQGFDITMSPEDIQRNRALFVDVGGAVGHQCIAFRENYPELKGPVILQDLPFIVELARQDPRAAQLDVTIQAHDFMTPETPEAKGAKIYYIRNVLHDWNDGKNSVILKHIADAMDDDSLLIIDEAVVPEMNVARSVVAYDMVMMAMPAAQERSEEMWRDLVERQVGLKVREIRTYDESTCDGLIFITKA